MDRILWIEEAVDALDGPHLRELVDSDEAIRIARQADLRIDDPQKRVDNFVENLPSLFDWFGSHYRDFPWRRTQDPWVVIVAEILLQRTHATAVEDVYGVFFERFPDAEVVVAADREAIFKTVEPSVSETKRRRR